jgi:radical SAM superfamily enzyme YgiQ (UPF0313 family)
VVTVWGGYFASNQYKVALQSGTVDYVINGPGDNTFPQLIEAIESGEKGLLALIKNLIYKNESEEIVKTAVEALLDQDTLPKFPYEHLDSFYPVSNYLARTFMGNKTLSYHSVWAARFRVRFVRSCRFTTPNGKASSRRGFMKMSNILRENTALMR